MGKNFKDIVISNNIKLNNLKLEAVEEKPESKEFDVGVVNSAEYDVVQVSDNNFTISLHTNLYFEPNVMFNMIADCSIHYKTTEKVSRDDIDSNIEFLLSPVAAELSLVTAVVSKLVLKTPIVIPPMFDLEEKA